MNNYDLNLANPNQYRFANQNQNTPTFSSVPLTQQVDAQRAGVAAVKANAQLNHIEQDLFQKLNTQKENEIKDQKKKKKNTWKAIGLTLATVIGLAVLGNKTSNKMANLGQKVDDLLLDKKWYQNMSSKWQGFKGKFKDFFLNNKNDFIRKTSEDFAETYTKRHAKNKLKMANGYGRGFEAIFSLTPPDIIRTSVKKMDATKPGSGLNAIKKLVGESKAQGFYEQITKNSLDDNRKFCKELTDAIAENFGARKDGVTDTKKLLKVFEDMQKGKVNDVDLSEFTNIKMNGGDGFLGKFMGDWTSVNIIDTIGEKISKLFGKKWNGFARGNLGDALVKVNAVNGSLAKTGAGSFVQKCITVPTESISNFVNDKSNMGILLSTMIFMLYQNMLKAPKEKKVATVADDYIGTLGSLAIATPLAFGATYKLATMNNLEGKTWLTKALKYPGKIFNLGLHTFDKNNNLVKCAEDGFKNKIKNFSGHTLRFALIMFVFSSLFMKPIRAAIQKIFGKPYDPTEDDKKVEAQKVAEQAEIAELYNQYIQNGGQPFV